MIQSMDRNELTREQQSEVDTYLFGHSFISALMDTGRLKRDADGIFSVGRDILLEIFGYNLSDARWEAVERQLLWFGKTRIEVE